MNTTGFIITRELFEVVMLAHFQDFPREYSAVKSSYLDGIMEAHELVAQKFIGSPKHPHYFLSYKDAGKVLSGILLGKKENIASTKEYGRLVIHECARVYQDRLETPEEKAEFGYEIDKVIEKYLNPKWKFSEVPNLIFSSITFEKSSVYKEVSDWQEIQKHLEELNPESNFVLFREAVEYIVKVARILILPRSHLINIGPSEMGRHSLLCIVARIFNQELFTLNHRAPNFEIEMINTFEKTLEEVQKEETSHKGIMLYCKTGETTDNYNTKESIAYTKNTERIMDSLYQLASTGEIRHIVDRDVEIDVRDYLHMVIQVPNKTEDLRLKTKMYPALFSECNILYQQSWSLEAVVSIANKKIEGKVEETIREKVAGSVVRIHNLVKEEAGNAWTNEHRKIFVAAEKQWELPGTFLEIYNNKEKELREKRQLLERAIENVEQSEVVEQKYQEENAQRRPEGDNKKKETDEAYAKFIKTE
jgi:dynein heavy chain